MGNEVVKNLRYFIKCLFDLIYSYEEKCIICGSDTKTDNVLCASCINNIKVCNKVTKIMYDNYEFYCYSSLYYGGNIKELILRLKYKSDFMVGKVLLKYMIDTIKVHNIQFDVVTYVPSSKNSLKKRGYNQSEYLARLLAEKMDKKILKTLEKIKYTEDQIGLKKDERWENLKNSFGCVSASKIKGKRILLVDDVLTTGATAFYCSKEIIKKGAKDVIILTVAKSNL